MGYRQNPSWYIQVCILIGDLFNDINNEYTYHSLLS